MNDTWNRSEYLPSPEGPTLDALIGTTVAGRYLIEKELGHGGVGVVYAARDRKLHDKTVVVKVLLEKSLRDKWKVQKFLQEKEALARIDHPGVVAILDTGELDDGKPFIVMQYVDGLSLRKALKEHPEGMDFGRVALIVKQVGAALSAVHKKKIYHRDLKPENIMLQSLGRGEEQAKIVDFGIAKIKESVVAPSTVTGGATAGTIVYMSPEQLHGDKINATSDIYSFGVITYELVTGRRPFFPDTSAQLYEMQRQGVPVRPVDLRPRLPQEAQHTILRALAFDAQDRYQDAAEFGSSLAEALTNDERPLPRPLNSELPDRERSQPQRQIASPWAETLVSTSGPILRDHQAQKISAAIRTRGNVWPIIVFGVLLLVGVGAGGYALFSNRHSLLGTGQGTTSAAVVSRRSLFYSLTVQKMRDGKPYQTPFQSSGQEIFETGYKFRLNISSPQAGYLYIFNEGADTNAGTSFNIIYPTPATNSGSAGLSANQVMQTNWNTFAGKAGTEMFWIIWSASPIEVMETARDAAFKNDEGAVTDIQLIKTLKGFLTDHSALKPETTKDAGKQQTELRGDGDLLVKLIELEHR